MICHTDQAHIVHLPLFFTFSSPLNSFSSDVHVLLLDDIMMLLQKQDERLVLKCQSRTLTPTPDGKLMLSPIIKLNTAMAREVATGEYPKVQLQPKYYRTLVMLSPHWGDLLLPTPVTPGQEIRCHWEIIDSDQNLAECLHQGWTFLVRWRQKLKRSKVMRVQHTFKKMKI